MTKINLQSRNFSGTRLFDINTSTNMFANGQTCVRLCDEAEISFMSSQYVQGEIGDSRCFCSQVIIENCFHKCLMLTSVLVFKGDYMSDTWYPLQVEYCDSLMVTTIFH